MVDWTWRRMREANETVRMLMKRMRKQIVYVLQDLTSGLVGKALEVG